LKKSVSKAARPAPEPDGRDGTRVNGDSPISSNPRDAHELLPLLREFFSRYPEYRHHEAWELQWLLYALGFSNDLEDENEIATRAETARRDFDPEEGAA
jgi:hypothetical protein